MNHAVNVLKAAWLKARKERAGLLVALTEAKEEVERLEGLLAPLEEEIAEYAGAIISAGGGWTDAEIAAGNEPA